ncbi:hypothetical protein B0J17DRAFT_714152 [Rhizoctonia solani]|nr:hypothetical protein B0J17DRAFT_714152 [Rhizoctonia solani]
MQPTPVQKLLVEPYPRQQYVPYRKMREPTWLDALNDWKVKSHSELSWVHELRREDNNQATHVMVPVLTCVVYERPSEDIQMHLRCAARTPSEALDGAKSAVHARLGKKALFDFYAVIEDNQRVGSHNRYSVINISYTYKLENYAVADHKREGRTKREAQQAAAESLLRGERYCMFIPDSNSNRNRRY